MSCCAVKTDKLADKHYKRVSNFAKEMLVRPQEIEVHKIDNVPQIRSASKPLNFRQQQPMKFGGYATGTERLAEVILRNQSLDPSPSRRTLIGNEVKVLNLRPDQ